MGSGELVRPVLPCGLVDRMLPMIRPVVLGRGRRLFGPGDGTVTMELPEATTTATGLVLARYRSRSA